MAKRRSKAKRRRAAQKRAIKKMAKQAVKIAEDKNTNKHHILWQAKEWDAAGEWSSLLRLHPYYIKPVPQNTLHKLIHSTIAGIPVPSQDLCRKAHALVERGLAEHKLDMTNDSIEKRIQLLLDI